MRKQKTPTITYNPEWRPDWSPRRAIRWVEDASRGLRVHGAVHELSHLFGHRWPGHTGYFLDPLGGGETVHGAVIQLPARDGVARFVPAVSDAYNPDCYAVEFGDVYEAPGDDTGEAIRDCAQAADRLAELYAEAEREFQVCEGATLRIAEAHEAIAEARADHSAAIAELRRVQDNGTPHLCKMIRDGLRREREKVRAARRDITRLTGDPYAWLN